MKRLILMRHAKSGWGNPGLPDHARPLNKRGRRAATALGHWLREAGPLPDEILCSTAARAQETCERSRYRGRLTCATASTWPNRPLCWPPCAKPTVTRC